MPIFEYNCRGCSNKFEEFVRSVNDESGIVCPKCQSGKIEKMFSVFGAKCSEGFTSSSSGANCSGCSTGHCGSCH